LAIPHKEGVGQNDLKMVELPLGLALWERLDDHERGYITHGQFWSKMQENPDIAEKLGLIKILGEDNGSTQIFQLMNPGSRNVIDLKKYERAFWIKFFTGQDLSKQEAMLQNWKNFVKELAGLPKWRKLVVRLWLENASLTVRYCRQPLIYKQHY
jgi:hypothetical protein